MRINDNKEIIPVKGIEEYRVEKAIGLDEKILLFYNGQNGSPTNQAGAILAYIKENSIKEEMKITQSGLCYGSNKWLYFSGAEDKIGRRLIDRFPEPEVVMGSERIIGSWDDWIYYVSNSYKRQGLYRLHSNTKVTQQLNDLDIIEARLYKNKLIYTYGKENALLVSDLDGRNQQVLVVENASFINVIDDWIFYSDGKDFYRVKVDGTQLELLERIENMEK